MKTNKIKSRTKLNATKDLVLGAHLCGHLILRPVLERGLLRSDELDTLFDDCEQMFASMPKLRRDALLRNIRMLRAQFLLKEGIHSKENFAAMICGNKKFPRLQQPIVRDEGSPTDQGAPV